MNETKKTEIVYGLGCMVQDLLEPNVEGLGACGPVSKSRKRSPICREGAHRRMLP